MKGFIQAASLAVLSASIAAAAIGQTTAAGRAGAPVPGAEKAARQAQPMYRGSKIIGANVRDTKDKKIGEIKDLMLDSGRGEVAYAVVSFSGVTGTGRKYHAIPWQALQPAEGGRYYVLNADKETLSQAPGFDRRDWPDMADQRWSADVDRYWNRMVGRGVPDNNLSSGASGVSGAQGPGGPTKRAGPGNGGAR